MIRVALALPDPYFSIFQMYLISHTRQSMPEKSILEVYIMCKM